MERSVRLLSFAILSLGFSIQVAHAEPTESRFTPVTEIGVGGGYQVHLTYQDVYVGSPQFHLTGRFNITPEWLIGVRLGANALFPSRDLAASLWLFGLGAQVGYRWQFGLFDLTPIVGVQGMVVVSTFPIYNETTVEPWLGFEAGLEFGLTLGDQHRFWVGSRFVGQFDDNNWLPAIAMELGYTLKLGRRSAPPLSIEVPRVEPVFPARYVRWPQSGKLSVRISNDSEQTYRNIQAISRAPELSESTAAGPIAAELLPGQSVDLEVNPALGPSLLNVVDETRIEMMIDVEFEAEGSTFVRSTTLPLQILPRNSITWDDTKHIGNFVTLRDEELSVYARNVIAATVPERGRHTNLSRALALFQAMQHRGIVYNRDPETPFDSLTASSIDSIQFPRELLLSKAGDCDDLVTLYAALLESLGIATAVITIPGHIFMAFDSGFPPSELWKLGSREQDVLIHGNTLWVPVEVTAIDQSFAAAWQVGAEQLREHRNGELAVIEVSAAMAAFGPVTLPSGASLTLEGADELVNQSQQSLRALYETLAEQTLAALPNSGSLMDQRNRAIANGYFGKFTEAETLLVTLIGSATTDAYSHIVLSEVRRIQGDLSGALQAAERGRALAQNDFHLELALRQLMKIARDSGDTAAIEPLRAELDRL